MLDVAFLREPLVVIIVAYVADSTVAKVIRRDA